MLGRQNQADQEGAVESNDTSTPQWWQAERNPHAPEGGVLQQHHSAAHRLPGGGGFAQLVQHLVERAKEEKAKALGETYHPPPSAIMAREEHELTAPASDASGPSTLVEPSSPAAHPVLSECAVPRSRVLSLAHYQLGSAVTPGSPSSQGSPSLTPEDLAQRVQSNKGSVRLQALSKSLNAGALAKIEAAIHDDSLIDDFKPHMLHKQHEPFRALAPSTLLCRSG